MHTGNCAGRNSAGVKGVIAIGNRDVSMLADFVESQAEPMR